MDAMKKQNHPPVFGPADILLPKPGIDLAKWAVVACDQFTSQPDYWRSVEETVGEAPSTLRLILPEAHLNDSGVDMRITAIDEAMDRYLAEGLFAQYPQSLIYMERTQSDGCVRRGLIGAVDLEHYDFTPGSGALIRATEGTVLERIPPRVRVRQDAALELPHVMLLIDDPGRTVIEPLAENTAQLVPLYDFELQQGGGHLRGWLVEAEYQQAILDALAALADPAETERKYGLPGAAPLLFAVGDGNHSLATAKACYEAQKETVLPERWEELPARYALVEVVNNHDPALKFEPIHRVLFGVEPEQVIETLLAHCPGAYRGEGEGHVLRYVSALGSGAVTVPVPECQLEVGTLQSFLDAWLNGGELDYVHGDDTAITLGSQPGNMAFLLPAMGKELLFKTVMADGVLPRKTFSMGHAQDKRYYMEARKIR